MPPRTADELRSVFCDFFADRDHLVVPSASLIPHDKTLLFTNAGMVPFKPYFVGDEAPPKPRMASVQKCVRAGGKHNDLEEVGRTNRHFTFFEMLGNFSFGDYFKTEAIEWAWELYRDVLQLPTERLWVTVHVSDDEAAAIWRDHIGLPAERIQRLDDDNFWRMADTGPCGPSSEIFWDLGDGFGAGGGPAVGDPNRFIEIWNLVFMQFDQRADERVPLPSPSIDTGAGLERNLLALQGVNSIFDIDVFRPLIAAAEKVTNVAYGHDDERDVSLRILAEHGRTMTFLAADGVVPSNEERGYVLRRIIRRAVRHAFLLGGAELVTPSLVEATVAQMGTAYAEIAKGRELVVRTVQREEERFRQTLERGLDMLDDLVAKGDVAGVDAFFLHDTLGFPIDLTREIAEERDRRVDLDGFQREMAQQRARAKDAQRSSGDASATPTDRYRELVDSTGATDFTGRQEYESRAVTRGLIVAGARVSNTDAGLGEGSHAEGSRVEVVLDRTPFYAESGGQVGDTGSIRSATAELHVLDARFGLPGLVVHVCEIVRGVLSEGDEVTATIDGDRRDRIRRNHTATHVLHWALREVLGSHVQQAGSHVSPERLRFDFSHDVAVTPEQLDAVEALANAEIITNAPVRHYETTKDHAEALGAIAFFGDKYGDLVRVLEAGDHSIELCGGTHVHALGFIGPLKIVNEGSVGANLRRIEAVTGDGAFAHIHDEERILRSVATTLNSAPAEVDERVERLLSEVKELRQELGAQRSQQLGVEAHTLAAGATDGMVVERRDGLSNDELRQLAIATRDALGSGIVALVGVSPDGAKGVVAVAVTKDLVELGTNAGVVATDAARVLGGGTGRQADVAVGGGPNGAAVDEARAVLRDSAQQARSAASSTR